MAVQNFGSAGGGYQLSPGVSVSEIDLTTTTSPISTTTGAFAGVFQWGPIGKRVLVTSENDLVKKFGKPSSINPETWFTAANFLGYGNALYVSRAANTDVVTSAVANSVTLSTNTVMFVANSTVVNSTADSIALTNANTYYKVGARVKYYVDDGFYGVEGLTNGGYYYVAYSNTTVIKLTDVLGGDAINIGVNTAYTDTANSTNGVEATLANNFFEVTASDIYNTHTIKNKDDYDTKSTSFNSSIQYIAKYPGALGNTLKVSVCDNANQYSSNISLTSISNSTINAIMSAFTLNVGSNTVTISVSNGAGYAPGNSINDTAPIRAVIDNALSKISTGDYIVVGNNSIGTQALKVIAVSNAVSRLDTDGLFDNAQATITFSQPLKLATQISSNTITRYWEYYNQVTGAPGRSDYVTINGNTAAQQANAQAQLDEMHVVVIDEDGKISGNPGLILEVYSNVSRATDAKLADNSSNYYKNIINERSEYIWAASDRSTAVSANAKAIQTSSDTKPLTLSFNNGVDKDETEDVSSGASLASIAQAYDIFASTEDTDISLIMAGKARGGANKEQLANYIIDNIAEVRQDCIVFVSPDYNDVVNQTTNTVENVIEFRNSLRSTSYAVMDSGYKYQYDKYNDVYRWIPLNGDIAGLCVRTDNTRDPWYSPAGTTRGQIRNAVKLAYNPNKAQRDQLYKNGINPVITQPGQGTFLFGDKTLLNRASAFDRINVRRLFIVLEKVISNAAKSFLFEFNDEFTRAQFRNLVEPYLRDVQGRRGIYDFKVVCDTTNNNATVIDNNRFVGDIYIKPAKSINFIQLNFIAVRNGVQFSEIVGG